jgi:hypothetical protein
VLTRRSSTLDCLLCILEMILITTFTQDSSCHMLVNDMVEVQE